MSYRTYTDMRSAVIVPWPQDYSTQERQFVILCDIVSNDYTSSSTSVGELVMQLNSRQYEIVPWVTLILFSYLTRNTI